MNIKATHSGLTIECTPDEWETVKRLGDFMVKEIEEQNVAFLELMRSNPQLTPRKIEDMLRNPLLRPI